MAKNHEKVYAICENKCMEETMTKDQIEEEFAAIPTIRTGSTLPTDTEAASHAEGDIFLLIES